MPCKNLVSSIPYVYHPCLRLSASPPLRLSPVAFFSFFQVTKLSRTSFLVSHNVQQSLSLLINFCTIFTELQLHPILSTFSASDTCKSLHRIPRLPSPQSDTLLTKATTTSVLAAASSTANHTTAATAASSSTQRRAASIPNAVLVYARRRTAHQVSSQAGKQGLLASVRMVSSDTTRFIPIPVLDVLGRLSCD